MKNAASLSFGQVFRHAWKLALLLFVLGMVIGGVLDGKFLSYAYEDTVSLWLDMETHSARFFGAFFLGHTVFAFGFTALYLLFQQTKQHVPTALAGLVWLVSSVHGMLFTYGAMPIPEVLIGSWLLQGLISVMVAKWFLDWATQKS